MKKALRKLRSKAGQDCLSDILQSMLECVSEEANKCILGQASNRVADSAEIPDSYELSEPERMATAMIPMELHARLRFETMGSEVWMDTDNNAWANEHLWFVFADTSEHGKFVTDAEMTDALNLPLPAGIESGDVRILLERFNNSDTYWDKGIMEPGPESSENMISKSTVDELSAMLRELNNATIEAGLDSYIDLYNIQLENLETWKETSEEQEIFGVCAKVRISLSQRVSLTREAFLAELEIENQEGADMTNIRIELVALHSSGKANATSRFAFGDGKAKGNSALVWGEGRANEQKKYYQTL